MAQARPIKGRTEPRLFTPPLRPLTRRTTRGFEVIDFAEAIGEPLVPWQQWLVKHALELNPDGTFRFRTVVVLVARQNGKSSVKRVVSLWRMYVDGARLVLGVAQDVSLAREQWQMCLDTITASPELTDEFDVTRRVNGDEWFRLTNGARYKIGAANRRAGRGLSVDELNIDELREQQKWDAWSALSGTTRARANAQTWAMSNAGDHRSIVLNRLRARALAGADESLGLFEWSGREGCALDSWPDIAQANPLLGYGMTEAAIRSALGTDPPDVFRTEVLCQSVDALDGAFDVAAWRECGDDQGTLSDTDPGRLAVGFDVAEDGTHATLAGAALMGDGRVRTAIIRAWRDTKTARAEVGPLIRSLEPGAVAWFPGGPAARLAPVFTGLKDDDGLNVVGLQGGAQAAAAQGLVDLVAARQLLHPRDALQTAHVTGSRKLPNADGGFRFVRKGAGAVDATYATAGAVHEALTMPEPVVPRLRAM